MSDKPLISVIIPAFNAASVIIETLESVRSQTFQNFEAIIVDDGSADDTIAVVKRSIGDDPRFRLISRPHAGLSSTRNVAMDHSRGEFIAFLDADDLWFPEKLSRQLDMFREDPRVNFSFTNSNHWDGQCDLRLYHRKRPLPCGNVHRQLILRNLFNISTVMVRRELILKTGSFDSELPACEDFDMWLRMAERGMFVSGAFEPLARYRIWSGNMSKKKLMMAESLVHVLKKNLAATQHPELWPLFIRALARAQAGVEMCGARRMIESEPDAVPGAVWRAWTAYPRQIRWLVWYWFVTWPKSLGGHKLEQMVHRKLIEKW